MVIVAAGEARYPRRDLPQVTRFMYLVPLRFAPIVALCLNEMKGKISAVIKRHICGHVLLAAARLSVGP